MTKTQKKQKKDTASWRVHGIDGLECFRDSKMVHTYRRHSHEEYSIGIIEDGIGGNICRGSSYKLPTGGVIFINSGEVHTGYNVGETLLAYRMFYIHAETFIKNLPEKTELPYFKDFYHTDMRFFQKLNMLHHLLEIESDTLSKQSNFMEILTHLTQVYGKTRFPLVGGKEPKAICKIKEYLHSHFREDVTIDDLAQITQLNRSYLMRSFRKSVGLPPYTYLLQIRIQYAKQLLAQGKSIIDIALEVGFFDQSHFTHHFKNFTGVTPKQYAIGHYSTRNSHN